MCISNGSLAEIFICDVSVEENCKESIKQCINVFGTIDLLILNAGINVHQKFSEMKDLSVFKQIMNVNFFGYVYMTKSALPHL